VPYGSAGGGWERGRGGSESAHQMLDEAGRRGYGSRVRGGLLTQLDIERGVSDVGRAWHTCGAGLDRF